MRILELDKAEVEKPRLPMGVEGRELCNWEKLEIPHSPWEFFPWLSRPPLYPSGSPEGGTAYWRSLSILEQGVESGLQGWTPGPICKFPENRDGTE